MIFSATPGLKPHHAPRDTGNFLRHWVEGAPPEGWADKPVTWVGLEDARAYAAWAGATVTDKAGNSTVLTRSFNVSKAVGPDPDPDPDIAGGLRRLDDAARAVIAASAAVVQRAAAGDAPVGFHLPARGDEATQLAVAALAPLGYAVFSWLR